MTTVTQSVDRFADGFSTPSSGTVASSAARTATATWEVNVLSAGSIVVTINVTAKGAAPSVVFSICGQDPVSGAFFTILDSAAVTGTGLTELAVSEHLPPTTNKCAQWPLADKVFITANPSNTDSLTYSIGAVVAP